MRKHDLYSLTPNHRQPDFMSIGHIECRPADLDEYGQTNGFDEYIEKRLIADKNHTKFVFVALHINGARSHITECHTPAQADSIANALMAKSDRVVLNLVNGDIYRPESLSHFDVHQWLMETAYTLGYSQAYHNTLPAHMSIALIPYPQSVFSTPFIFNAKAAYQYLHGFSQGRTARDNESTPSHTPLTTNPYCHYICPHTSFELQQRSVNMLANLKVVDDVQL